MAPRLLELFCGAGGAAMGYHRAGFEVVGVDIEPQPNYPFAFVQADALEYVQQDLYGWDGFGAIHASPPCQAFTRARHIHGRTDHPDLIEPTRALLQAAGLPYVIENVEGAPLIEPYKLCGLSLGLNVRRHRLFETTFPLLVPPCRDHDAPFLMIFGGQYLRRSWVIRKTPAGNNTKQYRPAPAEEAHAAMGIDWMTRKELSEAIPPAYTELIGHQLMQHIKAAA